jgi:7-cyano-7-deazaguanine synthase
MDSVTLLHQRKMEIREALSFTYGQKHKKEVQFALRNCERLGIRWRLVDLSVLLPHLRSNLLDGGGAIPEGHYEDQNQKLTVVPFRNGIMLSIACGIAESCECNSVLIANHAGDHAIYPDCRDAFIDPMGAAMSSGTYRHIQLEAPYTHLTKRDIGLMGYRLGIDYGQDTWTCYKGNDVHCGKCGSCVERKEALQGFDTTVYEE